MIYLQDNERHIAALNRVRGCTVSWCGSLEGITLFVFADIDSALRAIKNDYKYQPCPECLKAVFNSIAYTLRIIEHEKEINNERKRI